MKHTAALGIKAFLLLLVACYVTNANSQDSVGSGLVRSGAGITKPPFSGRVESGPARNPIAGSSVTLYLVGTKKYQQGATVLAEAKSDSDGRFDFGEYTLPKRSELAQTYVVARGGDAGQGSNSAIGLMALTGQPDNLTSATFVVVNELTTVAAEWALAQFTDVHGKDIGSPEDGTDSFGNSTGINNAVNQAETNLVVSNVDSGEAAGIPASFLPFLSGSSKCTAEQNCDGLERLDTLANIIAACVNSTGVIFESNSDAPCNKLFKNANTEPGGTTLRAAHTMATHPTDNVAALFDVQTSLNLPQFVPKLSAAPGDWTLGLDFTPSGANFSGPAGVAIDASGNVWITNFAGSSVTKLTSSGALVGNFNNSNTNGANFSQAEGVAIDALGNAWVTNFATNSGNSSVTKLTSSGALVGNFNNTNTKDAKFFGTFGVAIDASGNVWVTNNGGNSVTELTPSGGLVGNFAPTGAHFQLPKGIAIDAEDKVWVTNTLPAAGKDANSVTELTPSGGLAGYFNAANYFRVPYGVAIDALGHVWVTNSSSDHVAPSNSVSELSRFGKLLHHFDVASLRLAPFNSPKGLAIDASRNVWVANSGTTGFGNNSVTAFNPSGFALIGNFGPGDANFDRPQSLAIDASGNVWVANNGNNSVSELIGAAKPVLTPLVACLKKGSPAVCSP